MTTEAAGAPKQRRGRFYEDFEVGDIYRSRIGRTISETDNVWFTALTMNTNQVHFNADFAARTRFGQTLVNSCLTVALITGLSVPDTSENGTANLSWTDISSCWRRSSSATPSTPNRRSPGCASRSRTGMSASSACGPAA